MPVIKNLTPTAISSDDYQTAKTPPLGGEKQVYLTTKPSRLLGTALLTADGVIRYTFVAVPTVGTPGPILAVALSAGIKQEAADTITFAGLTGSFSPVTWTSNQSFDFPVCRAVELIGNYSAPTSSSVPTLTQAAGDGMLQGSTFALIEMPTYEDFQLAGCTNNRRLTIPARGTKAIPCGMNEAEWTTPGLTKAGSIEITGLNEGIDGGIRRYIGLQCQAMLETLREDRLITQRDFCLDVTPEADEDYPAGESEATITAKGMFSKMAVLPAP